MISRKKSQGMSINVIIIAALAIAVLVVLFAVFTGRISLVSKQLDSCTNKGGTCGTTACNTETHVEFQSTKGFTDSECDGKPTADQHCCIPVNK